MAFSGSSTALTKILPGVSRERDLAIDLRRCSGNDEPGGVEILRLEGPSSDRHSSPLNVWRYRGCHERNGGAGVEQALKLYAGGRSTPNEHNLRPVSLRNTGNNGVLILKSTKKPGECLFPSGLLVLRVGFYYD